MKKSIKVITLFAVMFIAVTAVNAQFVKPVQTPISNFGGSPPAVPPAGVPFDGGLSIILVAAGAGVAKRKQRRMQNS